MVKRAGASREKERTIVIKVPEDVYIALRERSKAEGYSLVADYIKAVLMKELGLSSTASRIDEVLKRISVLEKKVGEGIDLSKLESRILRKVMDYINPFTAKTDEIARRQGEIIERIESIEERVKNIEDRVGRLQAIERPQPSPRHEQRRRTGLERLREQGVLFESELQRLRDRDSFFSYLRRGGAKIIEAEGERIAVDREFWVRFKKKLFEEITTNNDDHIKMYLSKAEYRLFEKLRESGLIYFDSSEKKWKPITRDLIEDEVG